MIYLIGGSPRSGKSILSRKLSNKLKIPYISADNLRLVVLPYFSRKERNLKFPYLKMYDTISTDKFFQRYSGQEMLKADIREAKSIWPGVKSLINHLLVCKMYYIIEGTQLLPGLVKEFKNNKNVRIVFLTKNNEKKIYQGLMRNKNNSDWIVDNIKNNKTLAIAAKSLCNYGRYFSKEARICGFKTFNLDTNFNIKLRNIIKYLCIS